MDTNDIEKLATMGWVELDEAGRAIITAEGLPHIARAGRQHANRQPLKTPKGFCTVTPEQLASIKQVAAMKRQNAPNGENAAK